MLLIVEPPTQRAERGDVEIGCEFCGFKYNFDAVDVGKLFTQRRDQPPASTIVQ